MRDSLPSLISHGQYLHNGQNTQCLQLKPAIARFLLASSDNKQSLYCRVLLCVP